MQARLIVVGAVIVLPAIVLHAIVLPVKVLLVKVLLVSIKFGEPNAPFLSVVRLFSQPERKM